MTHAGLLFQNMNAAMTVWQPFAPWAQALSNVHVSVLAKEEMKRMIERETRDSVQGPWRNAKARDGRQKEREGKRRQDEKVNGG